MGRGGFGAGSTPLAGVVATGILPACLTVVAFSPRATASSPTCSPRAWPSLPPPRGACWSRRLLPIRLVVAAPSSLQIVVAAPAGIGLSPAPHVRATPFVPERHNLRVVCQPHAPRHAGTARHGSPTLLQHVVLEPHAVPNRVSAVLGRATHLAIHM